MVIIRHNVGHNSHGSHIGRHIGHRAVNNTAMVIGNWYAWSLALMPLHNTTIRQSVTLIYHVMSSRITIIRNTLPHHH